ncbi:SRPBCC family protein [Bacillus suaedaesalsae]|uniref:SRPBCC family protein n=1 Tax=Bacillus suaedaesalsae TaxID=2810349 RepID=A0ABS2DET0_9BACI|nr:SRPBCC family protein [Bacillus suaedaesalsae]MBM6616515.1 SRPBCC family protein [Bacillus suaedaesalsae]
MPTIYHEILIKAKVTTCFDLCRDINVHSQTVAHTKERIVSRHSSPLLEKGDIVTFEAVHFGVRQRLTAKVTQMERPYSFTDEMLKGAFKSLFHTHEFKEVREGTLMIDKLVFESPLGVLGIIANNLFLERYMERFIATRARELKKIAEGQLK